MIDRLSLRWKTCSDSWRRFWGLAFFVWIAGHGFMAPARASEELRTSGDVRLILANDFLASNHLDDDLYTSALELEITRGNYRISFGENAFTDSENDLRFDETYLRVERDLPEVGEWRSFVSVGTVRVGEGLLGEGAQNAIHRLVGDNEVFLPYIESERFHATVGLRFERLLPSWKSLSTGFRAEFYNAFDFQGHAAAEIGIHWPAMSWAAFDLALGTRHSWTSFTPLEARLQDFAPTWKAGVTLKERVSFNWSYNQFGTKMQHFNMAYHIRGGARREVER